MEKSYQEKLEKQFGIETFFFSSPIIKLFQK